MRGSHQCPRLLGALAMLAAMAVAGPAWSQAVRSSGRSDEPESKVSKVDAITIKQTTAAGYMKIEDIKGEATASGQPGAFEILSWSWGASQTRSRPGSGPGTLTITKAVDRSSPPLADASRARRTFPRMQLELSPARAGERAELMTFENVVITSVRRSNTGDTPTEIVTLDYGRIR